jgi:hypothetical protein
LQDIRFTPEKAADQYRVGSKLTPQFNGVTFGYEQAEAAGVRRSMPSQPGSGQSLNAVAMRSG